MPTTHHTRQADPAARTRPTRRGNRPRTPALTGPDGKRIRLSDLPLVAYWLACGCTGRTYGIEQGDLLFCDKHADRKKVTRTLS